MSTQDAASQAEMTPAAALQRLREGNARFCANQMIERDLAAQIKDTSQGQWPFAAILGCIDSRVSPEIVFDQGIGDLFSVRVAGNFVNDDILGSLEFATKVAGSRVIVVLGHSSCGAIKGACDDVQMGNLTHLLANLRPAVEAVKDPSDPAQRTSANPEFVAAVTLRNVNDTLAAMRSRSEILRQLEEEGAITIVGAHYDVASGRVEFYN